MTKLILHEWAASGNCYKIRLTAAHLGMELERREHDILKGETRTAEFLTHISANGRIPVLQTPEGMIAESNAACIWLAHGSALIPQERFAHADMLRWLFWEQYNHEPNIATLRYWRTYGAEQVTEAQRVQMPAKQAGGEAALALMDTHLAKHEWLVGGAVSVADLALYAYTHVAEQGGFPMADYPHVTAWCARVAALEKHIRMGD
jgi:glutathione S-transferase